MADALASPGRPNELVVKLSNVGVTWLAEGHDMGPS